MKDCNGQYFGKYRGTVANNIDPKGLGRIQVSVPAVLGTGRMSWAMPCVPYAGPQVGFFAIPPVGANVWVEFEAGDLDRPIWSGCFWGRGQVPADPALPGMKVFKTDAVTLKLSDLPGAGGFTLEVLPPAVPTPLKLVFDENGVKISTATGSIKMSQSKIELNQKPAKVTLSQKSIKLEISPKQTIELSPASVKINQDALEVT